MVRSLFNEPHQHSCHLFWAIKRQDKRDDEYNCELMFRDVVPVLAAPPKNGQAWSSDAITETFTVRVPYIVNTARIANAVVTVLMTLW